MTNYGYGIMQKVKELTENENIFFYRQICDILYVLLTDSRGKQLCKI